MSDITQDASSRQGDYVLGTNEQELQRLGLQHRVWRDCVLEAWRKAGISAGSSVLDVGAGPGYASLDLSEIVGEGGRVMAVERSPNFVAALKETIATRSITNIEVQRLDLMTDELPPGDYDFAWCRWVATFVSDPALLVRKIGRALRPGGRVIFHEYGHYETWRLIPPSAVHDQFVVKVVESWRASGGEPDIAMTLPLMLTENGFRLTSARPHVFCISPQDAMWQWMTSFVDSGLNRMRELGFVDERFGAALRDDFEKATGDPTSRALTPLVLELVAEKVG